MRTKRYTMPVFWPIPRKQDVYVTSPRPGPHSRDRCVPLQVIVRDILKLAGTGTEARGIIAAGSILVDKRVRRDTAYPVGLQDVLEIPDAKKQLRMVVNKRGLGLEEIKPAESDRKLCRIRGKTILRGGLVQINCHDGRNLTVKDSTYKSGDSILISLPEQAIIKHFPLKEGEPAVIIAGRNMGIQGRVKRIKRRAKMQEESTVSIQSGDREIQTLLGYIMTGEITRDTVPKKAPSKRDRPGQGPVKAKAGKKGARK